LLKKNQINLQAIFRVILNASKKIETFPYNKIISQMHAIGQTRMVKSKTQNFGIDRSGPFQNLKFYNIN